MWLIVLLATPVFLASLASWEDDMIDPVIADVAAYLLGWTLLATLCALAFGRMIGAVNEGLERLEAGDPP